MARLKMSALALSLLLAGCGDETTASEQQSPQSVEVEAQTVIPQMKTMTADLPGRIEPVRVAQVRARVAGIVQKRHFTEGAAVKEGELLFTIAQEPFEAALARAKAGLVRSESQVKQAESLVRRYTPLVKIDAVSRQEYDDADTALQTAKANRLSARADVKTAELDLSYATVRAPISGRVGKSLVSEGSLVGQGETTPMALIQQIDPVYADFNQPANTALQLREAMEKGQLSANKDSAPKVSIHVEGTGYTATGKLLFTDISVNRNTGEIMLRGEFPNPDNRLLPGMYVRVSTELGVDQKAIFIPQRAIIRGTDGTAKVFVINAEGMAVEKHVTTGVMQGKDWQITEGLSAGDKVIINGVDKIQPGMSVKTADTAQQEVQTPKQQDGNASS
ncbi:efflux RND transporter periplasmic adaptor subunit [Pectobacterium peruviense]|uniref:Efflux transporter periplasmic adaptor subunit n=1 Tax=Pectobacterium peruviense TaxID=2066479 RepID=A0ABX4S3L9_9GAMM|nr:efflux RND transporter periplasmic adaptor subunit [Pectobacterium peruviense]KML65729.1 RND transporter [Pectobacterium peruviense]PKX82454.1 efflux transporter periplasmic adaptor subunit [Pectobacterium peruviense]PKX85135.1 efflux transporter periplasmic adaptor subunit [Pectobacterium peruviense]